jgi:hypothetical protein
MNGEVDRGQNPLEKAKAFKETPHTEPLSFSQIERILGASLKIRQRAKSSAVSIPIWKDRGNRSSFWRCQ